MRLTFLKSSKYLTFGRLIFVNMFSWDGDIYFFLLIIWWCIFTSIIAVFLLGNIDNLIWSLYSLYRKCYVINNELWLCLIWTVFAYSIIGLRPVRDNPNYNTMFMDKWTWCIYFHIQLIVTHFFKMKVMYYFSLIACCTESKNEEARNTQNNCTV